MKKENEPKNKILSKRVLIAFWVVGFFLIVVILFSITSIEIKEKEPEKPSENNESGELLENVESEEDFSITGQIMDFPIWLWIVFGILFIWFNKNFWKRLY